MTVGELVEKLISLKRYYDIRYPDDNIVNLACNVLENLPNQQMNIYDLIDKIKEVAK